MVLKTGYILPPKSYVARMKALEQGLANNKLRTISALDLATAAKVTVPSAPAVAMMKPETGVTQFNVSEWAPTKPSSASATPPPTTPKLSTAAIKMLTRPDIPTTDTDLVKEIKQRLAQSSFGLKPSEERQKARDLKELAKIPIITPIIKPNYQTIKEATASTVAEDVDMINQDKQDAIDLANELASVSGDELRNLLEANKGRKILTMMAEKVSQNPIFKIPTSEYKGGPQKGMTGLTGRIGKYSIDKAIALREKDPNEFANRMISYINEEFGMSGSGLVQPNYMKNAPNFGNLFLNERQLKVGNLSISTPFSKTYLLHKKNITPLLKKMIMDIANTLEFDIKEYQQLEGDEKRIIEKIIRAQKNMKEYNIKKLIDDDDYKMKKRFQILVGEVNAGNASEAVKSEMKQIVKALFDNRAIGLYKYRSSMKAIEQI